MHGIGRFHAAVAALVPRFAPDKAQQWQRFCRTNELARLARRAQATVRVSSCYRRLLRDGLSPPARAITVARLAKTTAGCNTVRMKFGGPCRAHTPDLALSASSALTGCCGSSMCRQTAVGYGLKAGKASTPTCKQLRPADAYNQTSAYWLLVNTLGTLPVKRHPPHLATFTSCRSHNVSACLLVRALCFPPHLCLFLTSCPLRGYAVNTIV